MILKARQIPALGTRRSQIRFAWFPTRMDDGSIVWLERYVIHIYVCERWNHGCRWGIAGRSRLGG